MNKRQRLILISVCIIAIVMGFIGASIFNSLTNTTYLVELANGCTRQPNGQIVNTAVAGPSIPIHVSNNYVSKFSSFALSHGICMIKN